MVAAMHTIYGDMYMQTYTGKEKPKLKDIENYVVPKWASKWKRLGVLLNIAQHLMDNIEQNHPDDCEDCCSKMFEEWFNNNCVPTWEDIINAVDNLSVLGMLQVINYSYVVH